MLVFLLLYVFAPEGAGIYYEAEVLEISDDPVDEISPNEKIYKVRLRVLSGELAGNEFEADHFDSPGSLYNLPVKPGDRVLAVIEKQNGETVVGIDEHFKTRKLLYMSVFLVVLIAAVAGVAGIKALLALFFTLLIIFGVMAKMLVQGSSPVLLAIVVAFIVAIVNLLVIAGFSKKALVAALGTVSGVVLAGTFGALASSMLHLTGYTGDESMFLQVMDSNIDLKGVLIAGIIIGALGAVMDVAISIASSIQEISLANSDLKVKELFNSGMNIGRDIIGTMVNTLILAYTGASLTLILLFTMQREDFPLIKIMNMEFIAAETVRSLAGLFGMVLAIPVTALIASKIYVRKKAQQPGEPQSGK